MKKVGKYRCIEELGRGEFGTVYKAIKDGDPYDKFYAVKSISRKCVDDNPRVKKLFQNEFNTMSRIFHPNIQHCYEAIMTANHYYLVVDYCNNGDLETWVKNQIRLSQPEAIYFLKQIMIGFKTLHKNKIMHRDFKLANIFLNNDTIIIGDFGFAKQVLKETGSILGTPEIMAPEILISYRDRMDIKYTNKVDLWSIGICFYEMLFGKKPWDPKSIQELLEKQKNNSGDNLEFSSDAKISILCKDLLRGLLKFDPKQRIEWDQFFKHRVFGSHIASNQSDITVNINDGVDDGVRSSVVMNNKNCVDDEFFNDSLEESMNEVEQLDPENMDPLDIPLVNEGQMTVKKEELEKNFRGINDRIIHESNILDFMIKEDDKLYKCSSQKFFADIHDVLISGCALLIKKIVKVSDYVIYAQIHHKDMFNQPNMKEFMSDGKLADGILNGLKNNNKTYKNLLTRLADTLEKDENFGNYSKTSKICKILRIEHIKKHELNLELENQFYKIMDYYHSQKVNSQQPKIKNSLCFVLIGFYHAIRSDESFPFMKEGVLFDWYQFHEDLTKKLDEDLLNKVSLERRISQL